jgi:hypothetical protein
VVLVWGLQLDLSSRSVMTIFFCIPSYSTCLCGCDGTARSSPPRLLRAASTPRSQINTCIRQWLLVRRNRKVVWWSARSKEEKYQQYFFFFFLPTPALFRKIFAKCIMFMATGRKLAWNFCVSPWDFALKVKDKILFDIKWSMSFCFHQNSGMTISARSVSQTCSRNVEWTYNFQGWTSSNEP